MKKQVVLPQEFNDWLCETKKVHNEHGRVLGCIERMMVQLRNNAICGSWLEKNGCSSLLISPLTDGFSLLVCDNTHCYKEIVRDVTIRIQGRRLVIESETGDSYGDVSLGADGLLRCGSFGLYCREEELLRQELLDQMEFALRGNEECE